MQSRKLWLWIYTVNTKLCACVQLTLLLFKLKVFAVRLQDINCGIQPTICEMLNIYIYMYASKAIKVVRI